MRKLETFELYVDYLIAHQGQVSAIDMSEVLDNVLSYDHSGKHGFSGQGFEKTLCRRHLGQPKGGLGEPRRCGGRVQISQRTRHTAQPGLYFDSPSLVHNLRKSCTKLSIAQYIK